MSVVVGAGCCIVLGYGGAMYVLTCWAIGIGLEVAQGGYSTSCWAMVYGQTWSGQ